MPESAPICPPAAAAAAATRAQPHPTARQPDHHCGAQLGLDDLQGERSWDPYQAYAASKLALLLLAHELARRTAGTEVAVDARHPRVVGTLRVGYAGGRMSTAQAPRASICLASSPEVEAVTGNCFDQLRERRPSAQARDAALAVRLRAISERLAELT